MRESVRASWITSVALPLQRSFLNSADMLPSWADPHGLPHRVPLFSGLDTAAHEATSAASLRMSLLPKEHGAYGQVALPLVTAFFVAGLSMGGLLLAASVVAGFLVYEPAAILLGVRGPRARRERQRDALRWLTAGLAIIIAAGCGALVVMRPAARWSIAIPLAPALLLVTALVRGREKTWYGEVSASLAFAGAAVPVSMAAGASAETAAMVAIPFTLLFIASTLAVRIVILHVRRGGNPRAVTITRRAALSVAGGGAVALTAVSATGLLPTSVLGAVAPGLVTAALVAVRPPAATRLRALGWTLVAVSVLTAAIVIVTT